MIVANKPLPKAEFEDVVDMDYFRSLPFSQRSAELALVLN
jgi:hypothetical protein